MKEGFGESFELGELHREVQAAAVPGGTSDGVRHQEIQHSKRRQKIRSAKKRLKQPKTSSSGGMAAIQSLGSDIIGNYTISSASEEKGGPLYV